MASTSSSSRVVGETVALTSASNDPSETLIPGLPDDLATVILALLSFADQSRLRATARSWRALLAPRMILPLRLRLRLPSRNLLALFPADPALSPPCLFDPVAGAWAPLPPIPCSPHAYGLSNFVSVALGRHIYVLGGSQFDTRSYPLDHPTASAAAYRLDLAGPRPLAWRRLPDMLSPRGSFACATLQPRAAPGKGGISGIVMVAGGGSRHSMFPSEGSRMSSVEYYDVDAAQWRMGKGLPAYRAGCFGFFIKRDAGEDEFWVMGGYGEYETVASVVPSDVYYRNALVLGLESEKWRDVGDMWDEGERIKLGAAVAVEGEDGKVNGVFMLKSNDIFRYEFNLNRWLKESSLRKKIPPSVSCGFAAVNGELFVLTTATPSLDAPDARKAALKRRATLEIQVYNPGNRKWRLIATTPPHQQPIDFKVAATCTIRL